MATIDDYGAAGVSLSATPLGGPSGWAKAVRDAVTGLVNRTITTGAGLTGGGDLSADRTLAVGAGTGVQVNADSVEVLYGTTAGTAAQGNDSRLTGAVTVNAQTGTSYTLVAGDAGKLVELGNAAAIALTVPPNSSVAFPVGTRIDLLQTGAGQVTAGPGSGVTLNGKTGLKLSGQWAGATLIKRATDTWVLIGALSA